jgi:hypothetical protein
MYSFQKDIIRGFWFPFVKDGEGDIYHVYYNESYREELEGKLKVKFFLYKETPFSVEYCVLSFPNKRAENTFRKNAAMHKIKVLKRPMN